MVGGDEVWASSIFLGGGWGGETKIRARSIIGGGKTSPRARVGIEPRWGI